MGGATRNKQMLFKKRTKQIFLAKEDTRELKEQEQRPWILEDYDGQNSFTGTLEGGQRSDYVFFVLTENGFKVVPVDRWYKFQPKRTYRTLTLEEAEEQLKKQQKREQNRWMMMKRDKQEAVEERGTRQQKFKIVENGEAIRGGSDDESGKARTREDSDVDDLDFDDVFQDDEEGGGEHEVEDEDIKDSKERVKKETRGYVPGGEETVEQLDDEMNRLTSEGKQMRKLVRDLEKNRAYESDEEGDPYASSAEELGSDMEEEESKSDTEITKKSVLPIKKKQVLPVKPMLPKKTMTTKIRKEGLSKPIGRPGSPSLYIKREDTHRSHSLGGGPPMREASPVLKKRKPEESSHDIKHKHKAYHSPRESSSQSFAGGEDDLITEQEVIDTLRGERMTTKEFLMRFRKRIKKNERNREIVTELLKKVARHNVTGDPKTRTVELKPGL
ncbi:hypothetical protein BDF14DRAFT_1863800 [Spinellus fusiger]|nr:hypothetical protein BDF14DRAFT_1863800 [Spinellus fusiger]